MTTILAVNLPTGVSVYWDDLTVGGDNRPYRERSMVKVRQAAEYVVGAAGPGGLCEAILWQWRPPIPEHDTAYEVVVRQVVPSLRRLLAEHDYQWDGKGDPLQVLVCVKGEGFALADDGTVLTAGELAIGSGGAYALGALLAGATPMAAMYVASLLDHSTGRVTSAELFQPKVSV